MATGALADDDASARLGFHFDQHAHDAAVAAQHSVGPPSFDTEPPPPGVVRLPKYVVRDRRIPLEEHDVLTPSGQVDVAEKRYLTPMYRKTLGPLSAVLSLLNNPLGGWNPNAPEAMALYEQDEQIRRNGEMGDLLDLERLAESVKPAKQPPPAKKKGK